MSAEPHRLKEINFVTMRAWCTNCREEVTLLRSHNTARPRPRCINKVIEENEQRAFAQERRESS